MRIDPKPTKPVASTTVDVVTTQTDLLNPLTATSAVLNGICIMVLMTGAIPVTAGTAAVAGFAALAVGVKTSNRLTPDDAAIHIDYSEGSFTVKKDKNKASYFLIQMKN